jgi:uncharacterized repeat protein (TIGR02543 family)
MNGEAAQTIGDITGGTVLNLAGHMSVKTGHTFAGWYTNPECTVAYGGGAVYQDTTLYAKWSAQSYTVTFNGNGGTLAGQSPVSVSWGQRAIPPVIPPTRAGNTFAGWMETSGGPAVVDFTVDNAAIISADKTFYAKWTVGGGTVNLSDYCVVRIMPNYGAEMKINGVWVSPPAYNGLYPTYWMLTVRRGDILAKPEMRPSGGTFRDTTFEEWNQNPTSWDGPVHNFSVPVNSNIDLVYNN